MNLQSSIDLTKIGIWITKKLKLTHHVTKLTEKLAEKERKLGRKCQFMEKIF